MRCMTDGRAVLSTVAELVRTVQQSCLLLHAGSVCAFVQVLVKKVFGDSGHRASKRRWKLRHLEGVFDSDASSIQRLAHC